MIDIQSAQTAFNTAGISLKADFHTLRPDQVEIILDLAKRAGYRKPKNANGSTGRYYFQALVRRNRAEVSR